MRDRSDRRGRKEKRFAFVDKLFFFLICAFSNFAAEFQILLLHFLE